MIKFRLFFFFITFLGLITHIEAQGSDFLNGRLLDNVTDEPIVFATVLLKERNVGVVTNEDGSFRIPVKFIELGDTLKFSSMGYNTYEMKISRLLKNRINVIKLTPKTQVLDEVVLMAKRNWMQVNDIVKTALNKIPANYPKSFFSYVGYYRDYQKQDAGYVNFHEALVEVYDYGFKKRDFPKTNFRILKYERNNKFRTDSLLLKSYDYKKIPGAKIKNRGGNELLILRNVDAIRNYNEDTFSLVNKLIIDFQKNHSFERNSDVSIGEVDLYKISFKKDMIGYLAKGVIYISKDDFSIYQFNYSMERKNTRRLDSKTIAYLELIYEIKVSYRPYKGAMYPNYISFNNAFDVDAQPIFYIKKLLIDKDKQRLELVLSNPSNSTGITNPKNYKLRYKGKRVKIESIKSVGDRIFLYPEMPINKILRPVFFENDGNKLKGFAIEINNVRDIYGNSFDVSNKTRVNQFREFFVQEINPEGNTIFSEFLMDKNKPIFQNQPEKNEEYAKNYWMNTPLKNVSQKNRL